jgi:hypothetical protein
MTKALLVYNSLHRPTSKKKNVMNDIERQKAALLAMAYGMEMRLMEEGLDSESRTKLEASLHDIRKQLKELDG